MFIRTRLTLWYTSLLAALLFLFGISLYTFLSVNIYRPQDQELKTTAISLSPMRENGIRILQSAASGEIKLVLPPVSNISLSSLLVQLVSQEDGDIMDSNRPGLELPRTAEMLALAKTGQDTIQNVKMGKDTVRIYNTPVYGIIDKELTVLGIMQIAAVVSSTTLIVETVARFLFLLAVIIIFAAATSGWFLARKAFMPIEQVIAAAELVQNGNDLGRRIEFNGPPDEIGMLTRTINNMLGRIETTYRELEESNRMQRRFVSDASHELRTPLTTIRGNVELLEKVWRQREEERTMTEEDRLTLTLEAMGDIAGEASRMSRLVNDLLALARADAGVDMYKEPIEVSSLLEDVCRKAALLPRTADWRIGDLGVIAGQHVFGNADYLRQMLFIFIENSFKYTKEGHVLLEAVSAPDRVGIRISDTGIGMDKEEIPHIFERFYRADVSRGVTSGTGLGLSIAKWIIDEHDGSIEVLTQIGEGTSFLIWLPVVDAPRLNLEDGDIINIG
jgi:signal transduction histidine kinase